MSTNQESSSFLPAIAEGFDLRYGLRVLWSGKTIILAVTLVALAMGYLATSMQVPF